VGMLGMSNFGIENNGMLTLGMLNLGAASGTLNSGTEDDNKAAGLGGGCAGTLNFGGREHCHRHCHSQRPRLPKASGCCLLSMTAMAIIVDCSGGQWRRRQ
jgi:hypothetical protein